jgi:L,D-transpeptidase YcbB
MDWAMTVTDSPEPSRLGSLRSLLAIGSLAMIAVTTGNAYAGEATSSGAAGTGAPLPSTATALPASTSSALAPSSPPSSSSTSAGGSTSTASPATTTPAGPPVSDYAYVKPKPPKPPKASATRQNSSRTHIVQLPGNPGDPPPAEPSFLQSLFGGNGNANSQNAPDGAAAPDAGSPAATDANTNVDPGAPSSTRSKTTQGAKLAKVKAQQAVSIPDTRDYSGPIFDGETPEVTVDLGFPLLSPGNAEPMKVAVARYTDIVDAGGWPIVPPMQMEVGTNNDAVAKLRKRLEIEGDLKSQPSVFSGPSYFDQDLSDALRRFQDRYGLSPTGDLMDTDRLKNGTRTVMALNVPADARLAQLKANVSRLQQQTRPKGRYVLVNIPAQQIEAIEDDRVALRLNGVVGRPERPSPILSSAIEEVKFNPIWTLPPTVIKEDLVPKGLAMQSNGEDVLAKFGIDAYDGNGKKLDSSSIDWSSTRVADLRFSQEPGKDNPLGFAKLDFASPESVYMHDTPSSKLFEKSYRAASSGCIRVDRMDHLVAWLVKETDGWTPSRVADMKASGESQIVRLKRAVPLYWVYVTAWATQDGTVHFRRDLYGKDQAFGVSKMASAY